MSLYLVYKAFVEVGLTRPYDLVFRRLVESGEKLRLHVKQSSLAVIEWDADFRVAAWNPAAERTFGYAAAEALGQHASFIVPSRARPAVDGVWDRLSREQAGTESTNENLTKDGRTILCAWHNTPLTNAKRQFVGVTSLAEDVTERRRLEEKKPAPRSDCRVVRRRHHRRDPGRNHHQLEQGRGRDLRLPRIRGHRQADLLPGSAGPTGRVATTPAGAYDAERPSNTTKPCAEERMAATLTSR